MGQGGGGLPGDREAVLWRHNGSTELGRPACCFVHIMYHIFGVGSQPASIKKHAMAEATLNDKPNPANMRMLVTHCESQSCWHK